jgi:hypothetical protein
VNGAASFGEALASKKFPFFGTPFFLAQKKRGIDTLSIPLKFL